MSHQRHPLQQISQNCKRLLFVSSRPSVSTERISLAFSTHMSKILYAVKTRCCGPPNEHCSKLIVLNLGSAAVHTSTFHLLNQCVEILCVRSRTSSLLSCMLQPEQERRFENSQFYLNVTAFDHQCVRPVLPCVLSVAEDNCTNDDKNEGPNGSHRYPTCSTQAAENTEVHNTSTRALGVFPVLHIPTTQVMLLRFAYSGEA